MPILTPTLSPSEPDPALLDTLAMAKRICLGAVALIALLNLGLLLIPPLGRVVTNGWQLMNVDATLSVFFSAVSLHFSEPRHSREGHQLSMLLAALVALLACAVLCEYGFHVSLGIDVLLPFAHGSPSVVSGRMSPQTAGGFALLGIATILIQTRHRFAVHLADLLIFSLGMLVLIIVSGHLFGVLPMFGLSMSVRTTPMTLFCLFLLTQVALFRGAENGVFSILLGSGIGGRIARVFSPVLLVLPFLRETARAYIFHTSRLPANYATAIGASLGAMMSFALLLFIAWRINSMEKEIHELSLRDELTGLYNLKGFHLLAEQALRLAQRSQLPFSVLYIDLDNLKQINDSFGHAVGSATLTETGELLKHTFRETDVMGRLGGDEFAVAGNFSHAAISVATERLREASALRNSEAGRRFALNLSIGHVTSEVTGHESLRELLTHADEAMYEEKRRKKSIRG
jgi:diguanylate cyclase (GGDEF)-like protein